MKKAKKVKNYLNLMPWLLIAIIYGTSIGSGNPQIAIATTWLILAATILLLFLISIAFLLHTLKLKYLKLQEELNIVKIIRYINSNIRFDTEGEYGSHHIKFPDETTYRKSFRLIDSPLCEELKKEILIDIFRYNKHNRILKKRKKFSCLNV